jgi:tetratricopeptide (TPR) repeat protein
MLKDRIHSQRSKFAEMADEFYLMGNECMVKLKDPANAIRNFDKALFLNPMHVDAWVRKGVTLYDSNDFYEAEKCFNKAVELSPTLFKALYSRGKNRIQTNNFDGALSDLLKANSLKPEHKMTHELLGNVYSQLGEIELAMKHWDIAKGNDESDF